MNLRILATSVTLHVAVVASAAVWVVGSTSAERRSPPVVTFAPSETAPPPHRAVPPRREPRAEPEAPPDPGAAPRPVETTPPMDGFAPEPVVPPELVPADPIPADPFVRVRVREPAPEVEPDPPAVASDAPEAAFVEARALDSVNRKPDYPREAIARGLTGTVGLRLSIDATGRVTDVAVVAPCRHPILNRAALSAARTWRFEPARRDGVPVASEKDLPVDFRLLDR